MFDKINLLENMSLEADLLVKHYGNTKIRTEDMVLISKLESQICALKDCVYAKYNSSGTWAENNYLTGKSAIIHETHQELRSITKSIARGQLLNEHQSLSDALRDNLITSDHIDLFSKITDNKYETYLNRDIDLLVENAIKLDALHFSYVIKYWKSIVNDQLDEVSDEYKQFEHRRLFLNETSDGTWIINGQLDAVTGMILNKALENIVDKLWRNDCVEQRNLTSSSQYRADAIGYIAQGFINASTVASTIPVDTNQLVDFNFTSSITSDVIIDIETLNKNQSTRKYLADTLTKTSPIHKAHPTKVIEQILCDSQLAIPIMNSDSSISLGKKVRIAPEKIKRQLALEQSTCSIAGCSIPASWCDAHHLHHWKNGGETKIENLALLCRRHHTMIHNDKTFAEKTSFALAQSKIRSKSPPLIRTG